MGGVRGGRHGARLDFVFVEKSRASGKQEGRVLQAPVDRGPVSNGDKMTKRQDLQ